MTKRDKFYVLLALLCWLWFAVISASGCEFLDSPFGFVGGCYNYGVNWNAIIAPTGVFVLFAMPACVLYFIFRILKVVFVAFVSLFKRLKVS